MHSSTRSPSNGGFSLLELIIVLALIAALAGVITMRSGAIIRKGQVSQIIQLADTLKTACATYHADVGSLPKEYDQENYSGASRQLSDEQSSTGWEGPYLDEGITAGDDNPFGSLHLYNTPNVNGNTGFDLDGDGTEDVTSDANTLWLSGITEEVAQLLDEHFDSGVDGTWNESGRFNWSSSNKYAWILIYR